MGTATYKHVGAEIDYTPTEAVAKGTIVVTNDLIGVATRAIAADALGSLSVDGVFAFPKAAGSGISLGTDLYWDVAADAVNTDSESGANLYLGKCAKAAESADTTVWVKRVHAPDSSYSPSGS